MLEYIQKGVNYLRFNAPFGDILNPSDDFKATMQLADMILIAHYLIRAAGTREVDPEIVVNLILSTTNLAILGFDTKEFAKDGKSVDVAAVLFNHVAFPLSVDIFMNNCGLLSAIGVGVHYFNMLSCLSPLVDDKYAVEPAGINTEN